jgi:hypothetical protein
MEKHFLKGKNPEYRMTIHDKMTFWGCMSSKTQWQKTTREMMVQQRLTLKMTIHDKTTSWRGRCINVGWQCMTIDITKGHKMGCRMTIHDNAHPRGVQNKNLVWQYMTEGETIYHQELTIHDKISCEMLTPRKTKRQYMTKVQGNHVRTLDKTWTIHDNRLYALHFTVLACNKTWQ